MTSSRAGFSLLEVLVVVTLLALLAGLSFAGLRPPSKGLRLSRQISELEKRFAEDRLAAVRLGQLVETDLSDWLCNPEGTHMAVFRPDGTARGPDICLSAGDLTKRFAFDHLTGRLIEATP